MFFAPKTKAYYQKHIEKIDRKTRKGCGPESNFGFIFGCFFQASPKRLLRKHLRLAKQRREAVAKLEQIVR